MRRGCPYQSLLVSLLLTTSHLWRAAATREAVASEALGRGSQATSQTPRRTRRRRPRSRRRSESSRTRCGSSRQSPRTYRRILRARLRGGLVRSWATRNGEPRGAERRARARHAEGCGEWGGQRGGQWVVRGGVRVGVSGAGEGAVAPARRERVLSAGWLRASIRSRVLAAAEGGSRELLPMVEMNLFTRRVPAIAAAWASGAGGVVFAVADGRNEHVPAQGASNGRRLGEWGGRSCVWNGGCRWSR